MIEINKWGLELAQDLGNKYNLRASEIYLEVLEALNQKLSKENIKVVMEATCNLAIMMEISFKKAVSLIDRNLDTSVDN